MSRGSRCCPRGARPFPRSSGMTGCICVQASGQFHALKWGGRGTLAQANDGPQRKRGAIRVLGDDRGIAKLSRADWGGWLFCFHRPPQFGSAASIRWGKQIESIPDRAGLTGVACDAGPRLERRARVGAGSKENRFCCNLTDFPRSRGKWSARAGGAIAGPASGRYGACRAIASKYFLG